MCLVLPPVLACGELDVRDPSSSTASALRESSCQGLERTMK